MHSLSRTLRCHISWLYHMYILAIFPLDNTLSVQVLPMYPTFYYLNYFPFTQAIFFPYLTVSQSSLSLSLLTSSHPLPFTQPLFFDQPIPYLAADWQPLYYPLPDTWPLTFDQVSLSYCWLTAFYPLPTTKLSPLAILPFFQSNF